ncbi:uncharacterized protein LOC124463754 [Hypomesus transpacificus]|uniref:uncharacterized protein LOC124463748 n=1 Tax=Hypomesus transpacificus TaxID=137520 RepID=UPI001F07192F|nr:uncharacterized protein LOC124463748 [Hypomesus transpacificus]XP_046871491.1 uncharacterized protein LOC124463752 [Hypomesus transpacificus]XP_046871494.1 uncharacterized protein LOC124463754 [Hypomesus transpacificus]
MSIEMQMEALQSAVSQRVEELKAECARLEDGLVQAQRRMASETKACCAKVEARMLEHLATLESRLSAAELEVTALRLQRARRAEDAMAQRVAPSPVLMADPVDRTPSPRHSPPAVSQTDSRHGSPQTKRPLSPQDGLMRGAPSKRPSSPQDGQMEDAAEPKKRRVVLSYEDLDPAIRVRVLDYRPAVVDKRELLTELQLAHLLMSLDHFEIRDAVDLEHKAVQVICLGAVHGVWPDQPWAPPNCSQTFLCYVMDKIRTHLKTVAKRALLEKLRQSYLEDLAHQ